MFTFSGEAHMPSWAVHVCKMTQSGHWFSASEAAQPPDGVTINQGLAPTFLIAQP
jgi:hypothetical protein